MSKKIISWILVIIWMIVIFLFSNVNATESVSDSRKLVNISIETTLKTTNKLGVTNKHPSENKINNIVKSLDIPTRKTMHIIVYFILGLLLYNALYRSGIRNNKLYILTIIICLLYAISDEYHQLYSERNSSYIDVLIDTIGSILGTIFTYKIYKNTLNKNNNNK